MKENTNKDVLFNQEEQISNFFANKVQFQVSVYLLVITPSHEEKRYKKFFIQSSKNKN